MTWGFETSPNPVLQHHEDLAFLLALVADGDRDALGRLFDTLYPPVHRWLSAGIHDVPRRNRLIVEIFLEVWARAEEFGADRISPLRWVASVVSDVLRTSVGRSPTAEAE